MDPVATWNATTGVLTQASSVTGPNVSGEDSAFYRLDVQQVP